MVEYTVLIKEKNEGLTVGTVFGNGLAMGQLLNVKLHDENGMGIEKEGVLVEILEEIDYGFVNLLD